MEIDKNKFIYICFLISLINVFYIISFFVNNGYLPSPFIFDKNNTFMDFYNPLYWVINDNAYSLHKSIYPPLSFIILSGVEILVDFKNYDSSFDLREDNIFLTMMLLIFYLLIIFYSFNIILWRELIPSTINRIVVFLSFIFSTPILFSLERGNIIFLTLPIFAILLQTQSKLKKYLSFAILINLKPYFILFFIALFKDFKKNRINIISNIIFISVLFFITSYLYNLNIYDFFYNFIDFTKSKPIPFFDTLSMPLSFDALTSFRYYSKNTHSLSTLFFLPTILNKLTIIYLIYLLLFNSLESSKYILGATLIMLNFSTNIGGYAYLLYIPIIPILLKEKNSKFYIFLLFILFILPLDIIRIATLHNNIFSVVDSYLGQITLENIVHSFTLGSVIRPIANYLILFLFTNAIHQILYKKNIFNSLVNHYSNSINYLAIKLPFMQSKNTLILSIFGLIAICIFYNALFGFGNPPLSEGWFLAIAHLITLGKIPYVDFHLYLTPLYPLAISWYTQLFGESFYSLRILGLLVTTGIWCVLFLILNRKFSPSISLLATTTSMVFYESGVAFISYDFTQVLILLFLCTTYALCLAHEYQYDLRDKLLNRKNICFFSAGLFSSTSFFIKQSNGSLIVVGSMICAVLIVLQFKKHKAISFFSFIFGGILPTAIILLWLLNNNALFEFWSHIFDGAIAAKGQLKNILFAWLLRIFTPSFNKSLFIFLVVFAFLFVGSYALNKKFYKDSRSMTQVDFSIYQTLIFFSTLLATIYFAYFLPAQPISSGLLKIGSNLVQFIAPIAICTTLFMLFVTILCKYIYKHNISKKNEILPLIGIMTLALIWGNGTSGGVGEMALFLPFSIFICLILEIKRFKIFLSILILIGCVSLVSYYSTAKFNVPYYWWGLQQGDSRLNNQKSSIPLLANLKLSESEKSVTDELVAAIAKSNSGDIFAFPNIPMIYLLSDRWPNSKVLIQWFDFLPDQVAIEESYRILNSPPQTIVNLTLPELVWDAHETIFRNGNQSGQRAIQNAITTLTIKSDLYTHSYLKILPNGYVLDVWNLKDTN